MINFIGIGAQKSGTSWVYACLYEHPDICAPIKEIHFFSRDRFNNGITWYEDHFKKCSGEKICGEYSTSYLFSAVSAERIYSHYPNVKIIAILRNPITRAYSQYGNAIKAGEISESVSFSEYIKQETSVLEQGLYAVQLKRYFRYFNPSDILVLIYEDSKKDPHNFIKRIYEHVGATSDFMPSMLYTEVNIARVPKNIQVERMMHRCAEFLRRKGLDRLVYYIRRLGIPDMIRVVNTKKKNNTKSQEDNSALQSYFDADVKELSHMLGRNLTIEWGIGKN